MSVNPFANRAAKRQSQLAESPATLGVLEMALDTLATVVRMLGEYALDQEDVDPAAFNAKSEQWAQHILVAAPPPGSQAAVSDGRRDWAGVREFARDYCQSSSTHTRTVIADLRQVVWVFIQNLSQTVSQSAAADERIRAHLGRLESVAQSASTGDLKREVLSTVVAVAQVMEERKRMDHERVEDLGATVKKLGQELESARKEGDRKSVV